MPVQTTRISPRIYKLTQYNSYILCDSEKPIEKLVRQIFFFVNVESFTLGAAQFCRDITETYS